MQVNQTPIQSPIQSPMFTRISTRKTRRFFAINKAPTSKAATAQQRKAAKASGLALLFKIIFG